MANYVMESPKLGFLLNRLGKRVDQGALNNLRVDSELILYILNGTLKINNVVPSHSIITRTLKSPIGGDPSDSPKRSMLSEILSDSKVARIHNNMENDEVVATISQAGGIKEETMTIIDDEVHTELRKIKKYNTECCIC
ncbi:MAG: hypothetical protein IPL55_00295 [Saprospiraceae bacterium]|nr:hypothetical protein [Saprospiraceae bacterium]